MYVKCRFERDAQLGGRAQEVQYGGLTLEVGASIVWEKNYLVSGLAAAAGLQREPLLPGLFAIYDGRELVFEESPWRLLTLFRLLWRYWLSWFMVRAAPAATFAKFEGTLCDCCAAVLPPFSVGQPSSPLLLLHGRLGRHTHQLLFFLAGI